MENAEQRTIIMDGDHTKEVLHVLRGEINDEAAVQSILEKAVEVISQSVDPIDERPDTPSDGLIYGLIQSGKTSVITVATALAADNGFRCIIVLTSDIDLLYAQTLERLRRALRGLRVMGKDDWRDHDLLMRQLRNAPLVIVCSKNGRKLQNLLESFRLIRAKSIPALIIDDEADQATLNTNTSRAGNNDPSRINRVISELRNFFPLNTYLQVTATPQALFLQRPGHRYRPTFTVLTSPGPGYVGGDFFFGDSGSSDSVLREVDINEVNLLRVTNQPAPSQDIPPGLKNAICTFAVAAASRIVKEFDSSYSFLCHVSVNQRDHAHIVFLIERFKEKMTSAFSASSGRQYDLLIEDLRTAYDDLSNTETNMPPFDQIIDKVKFYMPGANIRLVNASSNDEIELDSAFNIFVGGNKLGRGVTIRNLLVSYYGRNPQRPNADTVLQHARMYGYRQRDAGVTRLFLPDRLAEHFRLIHQMEDALRDLVERHPRGQFEGIFICPPLQATRRNVLDPNSIGIYVGGGGYNPRYPLRTPEAIPNTAWLDEQLKDYPDERPGIEVTIDFLKQLIKKCSTDPAYPNEMWNTKTLEAALETVESRSGTKAYLVIRRNRDLTRERLETAGVISGGEGQLAPVDAPTLFLYRQNPIPARNEVAVWWPQLRFPAGNYALAFSFDR